MLANKMNETKREFFSPHLQHYKCFKRQGENFEVSNCTYNKIWIS